MGHLSILSSSLLNIQEPSLDPLSPHMPYHINDYTSVSLYKEILPDLWPTLSPMGWSGQ